MCRSMRPAGVGILLVCDIFVEGGREGCVGSWLWKEGGMTYDSRWLFWWW